LQSKIALRLQKEEVFVVAAPTDSAPDVVAAPAALAVILHLTLPQERWLLQAAEDITVYVLLPSPVKLWVLENMASIQNN
jgi:hypothetical protein